VAEKPFSPSVLLAHFDPRERERLAALLRAAGAEVVQAADGDEAARKALERRFDLALASCMLPQLSGFELCRQLSAAPVPASGSFPPVPTVLLSDVDDPYVRARARHVGAKRVLFGALSAEQAGELLATSWDSVDPLDLSSRERGGASDRLFRELLTDEARDDGSLLAKVTDPLTGLVNAEYLALKTQEECKRSGRYGQPLALLIAEIESFDQLVERYGRQAADEALLEIAGVFLCESRDIDVAGRVGPARFHLLLPSTALEGVRAVAHRIAGSLNGRALAVGGQEVPLVVRMGVTALPGGVKLAADEFVRRAEADLASAQISHDGRGHNLRSSEPVEPIPAEPPGAAPRG
jgi:diguanylate cyclase (GGDEF)-like protein